MNKRFSSEIGLELYRCFADLIGQTSGLCYTDQFQYILLKALKERKEKTSSPSYEAYFIYLTESRAEYQQLVYSLTTGETYFFRFPQQLNILRQKILPELCDRFSCSSGHTIRIWSAGCSTGEEPYSLAILLDEAWNNRWNQFSILGTDLNQDSLEKARRGVYDTSSFRVKNLSFRNRYFTESQGKYRLNEMIRERVNFQESNLLQPLPFPVVKQRFHIILCRNVLIYFDPGTVSKIREYLYERLEEGGYLLLGHSEIWGEKEQAGMMKSHSHSIYQKAKPACPKKRSEVTTTPLERSVTSHVKDTVTLIDNHTQAEAEVQAEKILSENWYLGGLTAYQGKDFILAEKLFLTALDLVPDSEAVILSMAYLYADLGEMEKAWQKSEELLQVNSLQAEAYFIKGMIALHKQHLPEAEKLFRRCVYCNENHIPGLYYLGSILDDFGLTTKAGKTYAHALDLLSRLEPSHQEMPWEKSQFYRHMLHKCLSITDEQNSVSTLEGGV
jgi:chemotaxis protein methyltransferase CheR